MGFAVLLALLLTVGAVVARRRRGRGRAHGMSGLDAEADANRWVLRLGSSLSSFDVRARAAADKDATQALADASERLRTARAELTTARTAAEYALVTRTAVEGLHHIRTARASLGLDPEPDRAGGGPVFAGTPVFAGDPVFAGGGAVKARVS